MKLSIPKALPVALILLIVLGVSGRAQAQTYIGYKIQLNSDGSAVLTISQVSDLNGQVDSWTGFQQKAYTLVSLAMNETHRSMSVDNSSFQIIITSSNSSESTTKYVFSWLDFSKTGNNQLVAGDIFGVPGFFNYLYGDGALQIIYPANFTLQSVSPAPDENDSSTQTLQWLGTQFFLAEKPNIILQAQTTSDTPASPTAQPYFIIGGVSAGTVAAAVVGWFFLFKKQKRKQETKAAVTTMDASLLETEEEKIVRVLRSKGGSAYQSFIKEQCNFSKAKTSQLLSALEAKGVVGRVKKGRDKIVNLIESAKGDR